MRHGAAFGSCSHRIWASFGRLMWQCFATAPVYYKKFDTIEVGAARRPAFHTSDRFVYMNGDGPVKQVNRLGHLRFNQEPRKKKKKINHRLHSADNPPLPQKISFDLGIIRAHPGGRYVNSHHRANAGAHQHDSFCDRRVRGQKSPEGRIYICHAKRLCSHRHRLD